MTKLLDSTQLETKLLEVTSDEYGSGDVVDPGVYIDVDTGAVVKINQPDELPEGHRVIQYRRRFRRVDNLSRSNI